jgi:putative glutathione S-transferase
VRIRQAWPTEYPEIEELLVSAFTTGCWVAADYEKGLRKLAERSSRFHIWVAASAERILGVVLTPRLEYWDRDFFTFSILAVHPAGRGQRLGEALVRHCLKLARTHGFARVEIHSSPQMSEAHRLYYRLGFARHIEDETIFVGEHEERLLTLSYRIPDPLPRDAAIIVPTAARPLPDASPFAFSPPDRSAWPTLPPSCFEQSGSYLTTPPSADLTAERAAAIIAALDQQGLTGQRTDGLLAGRLVTDLWAGAYTVLYSPKPEIGRASSRVFFAKLDLLNARLRHRQFLHGAEPGTDDAHLAAILLSYDFGWRAGFGPACGAVANFPQLWDHARRLLARTGLSGLVPADGSTGPWGAIPPTAIVADLRAGWLEPVPEGGSPARIRPSGARPTPYSADWPVPSLPEAALAELSVLDADAAQDASGSTAEATLSAVRLDLHQSVIRMAQGGDALTQQALRRVFFARLSWLEALLASQEWLSGETPGRLDASVFPLLRVFDTGLREAFPPIDPSLADYPKLQERAQL